jgi:hypothetical protein
VEPSSVGSEQTHTAEEAEPDTGDMEVIRIDDEPVTEEPIIPERVNKPAEEPIDPLHLKPKHPRPVGNDGGTMF